MQVNLHHMMHLSVIENLDNYGNWVLSILMYQPVLSIPAQTNLMA